MSALLSNYASGVLLITWPLSHPDLETPQQYVSILFLEYFTHLELHKLSLAMVKVLLTGM